jgi:3-keto-5-aminohexanoate cleavage enzyme
LTRSADRVRVGGVEPMIIEVAINELASKTDNANIPYGIDDVVADAVAAANAGAAIVHLHARDAVTGEQLWHDTAFYREAFARIREQCDALLYPTQPGSGMDRCPHVIALADEGLDLATVDIFSSHSSAMEGEGRDPNIDVMRALNERGVPFSIGVREIGHMRKIARYREHGLLIGELHLKIFLDEDLVGPVPDARGLLMFLDHLAPGEHCHWFTTLYRGRPDGRRFRELSMLAAAMGGHIRTGLGDCPTLDGRDTRTNADMVHLAVDLAHTAGREVATAADARAMLRS